MTQIEAMRMALGVLEKGDLLCELVAANHLRDAIQAAEKVEPVAWAMRRADGLVLDVICPDEHESHEGDYTMPLYAAPPAKPLTDDRRREIYNAAMTLPDRSVLSVMRYIEKEIAG